MRGTWLVVLLLLLAGGALLVRRAFLRPTSAPPPEPVAAVTTPTQPAPPVQPRPVDPVDQALRAVQFTPPQLKALLDAGFAVQKGIRPSTVLTPEQLATFPEVERLITETLCPPKGTAELCSARIDVPRCIDRAAEIIDWRHRERERVDRKLFTSAMGVSVTGREYPEARNLVKFCREIVALDASSPPESGGQPLRNPS